MYGEKYDKKKSDAENFTNALYAIADGLIGISLKIDRLGRNNPLLGEGLTAWNEPQEPGVLEELIEAIKEGLSILASSIDYVSDAVEGSIGKKHGIPQQAEPKTNNDQGGTNNE